MKSKHLITTLILSLASLAVSPDAKAVDFIVYSVYKGVDMGGPGESAQKDYYINMGSANGVQVGSVLEVRRRIATYDLLSQKLYKDVDFAFAKLKVIHVEPNLAVARFEQLLPPDSTPAMATRAVMVGDAVQISK